MNEWQLVWITGLKVWAISFFTMCYIIGGRDFKWVRRFLGGIGFSSLVTVNAILIGSFHWILLTLFILMPLGLSLGYGEDSKLGKFWPRFLYGLYFAILGLVLGYFLNLTLGIFQFFLALITTVVLGTRNPVHAVYEEALIALGLTLTIPFMI